MRIISNSLMCAFLSTDVYCMQLGGGMDEPIINFHLPKTSYSVRFSDYNTAQKTFEEILQAEANNQKIYYLSDMANTVRPNNNSIFKATIRL